MYDIVSLSYDLLNLAALGDLRIESIFITTSLWGLNKKSDYDRV